MKKNKLFGIGAVVLMVLVAFAPAIDGMQLGVEKENEKDILTMGDGDWDLELTMEHYGCALKKIRIRPKVGALGHDIVEYNCVYKITNVGTESFNSNSISLRLSTKDETYELQWSRSISLSPGGSYSDSIHIELISSYDWNIDEEKNLAGKNVKIEFTESYDKNPNNDFCVGLAKFWLDDPNYLPTCTQTLVSPPSEYEIIPHNGSFYLDFFDVRILPTILKSNRLGWIGEASKYLAILGGYVAAMVTATILFFSTIKDDVVIVSQWIIDFIEWIYNAIYGHFYGGFINLINDFFNFVLDAIKRIVAVALVWGGEIALLVAGFLETADAFYNWTLDDPWTKPIDIEGDVNRVSKNEVVTVRCRNEATEWRDPNGDGTLEYWMQVSSEPMYNEKHQAGIHKCHVIVTGTKHNGEAESIPLLSWAFANGTLYNHFKSPGDRIGKEKNDKQSFIERFSSWLKNRPLFIILEKIFEKMGISKKTETTINRDFDLDALVQRAIEEEKQYEQYEMEYREYFSGAPSNPNIVYYSSDQVIVGFKDGVDVSEIDDVLGYPVVDWLVELNVVIVEIYAIDPDEFIDMVLEQLEDVEYAELNYIYQTCFIPNDPLWDEQWGPKAIKCPQAWDIVKGYVYGVDVAILDTGCNVEHEDIPTSSSYLDYDFVNNDDNPADDCWVKHGTHCAGIIGAKTDNGKGIAGVVRVSKHYGKVLDSDGAGYASNIAKAIVHMAKSGRINVISMSLGGYGISVLLHIACDYAYYIKGCLIVAAAGNDGLKRLCYPARFGSVISVGAVDKNLNLCSWSNHGPNLDLVAPGKDIISTYQTSGSNMYKKLSGTSMATPHVAGVAALYFCTNPSAGATLCKGRLFSTAIPLSNCGHGLINAYAMVKSKDRHTNFQQFFSFLPRVQQLLNALQRLQIVKNT